MIAELPHAFPSRDGVPMISRVDMRIFHLTYFTHCLQCGFCHDQCCDHGVDVDLARVRRIWRAAEELEDFTGIPRSRWLSTRVELDDELPGGGSRRTRVRHGACVFLHRSQGGCLLHAFALKAGMDYHDIKSVVDCLFPLTFADHTLLPAEEVIDGTLVCTGTGPTLYRGLRGELAYFFGGEFVTALDALETGGSRS